MRAGARLLSRVSKIAGIGAVLMAAVGAPVVVGASPALADCVTAGCAAPLQRAHETRLGAHGGDQRQPQGGGHLVRGDPARRPILHDPLAVAATVKPAAAVAKPHRRWTFPWKSSGSCWTTNQQK